LQHHKGKILPYWWFIWFICRLYLNLNKKTSFFSWKQGATLKLKTNRNYSVYEMGCPFRNPSLFTLKFDSLSQFYFLKQLKALPIWQPISMLLLTFNWKNFSMFISSLFFFYSNFRKSCALFIEFLFLFTLCALAYSTRISA